MRRYYRKVLQNNKSKYNVSEIYFLSFLLMSFGKAFRKAGFGWDRKFDGGNDRGGDFGGKPDFEKGRAPMMGQDEDDTKIIPPAWDEEGGDDEKKEMKPETPKEEGAEHETIEAVLELFDQLTPLIEKLRTK